MQEKSEILGALAAKAHMTSENLNEIDGVSCNELTGAMYAFPRVFLPEKAIVDAKVVSEDLFFHRNGREQQRGLRIQQPPRDPPVPNFR